jgi:hypothetical protein
MYLRLVFVALLCWPAVSIAADEDGQKQPSAAVKKALEFLKQAQEKDGSWRVDRPPKNTAATGLSVLAFLSAGHGPGQGAFGDVVERGIRPVLKTQTREGLLGVPGLYEMYQHGICTLMLAEVLPATKDKKLAREIKETLAKAVKAIVESQRKEGIARGGWRYQYKAKDADLSVTGWQILALLAAKKAGADVPADSIRGALDYVKRCHSAGDGRFRYQPSYGPTSGCTAIGILSLELTRTSDEPGPEARKARLFLLRHPPSLDQAYAFYTVFFSSHAMFALGGNYWKDYRPLLQKLLVESQAKDGSWLGRQERYCGPSYATAIAVLALTVEQKRLSIQRREERKASESR